MLSVRDFSSALACCHRIGLPIFNWRGMDFTLNSRYEARLSNDRTIVRVKDSFAIVHRILNVSRRNDRALYLPAKKTFAS
jgi:hypothetical protein